MYITLYIWISLGNVLLAHLPHLRRLQKNKLAPIPIILHLQPYLIACP